MFRNLCRVLLVCASLFLIQACGDDSKPDHKDALQQIEQSFNTPDFMKLSKMTYENGYEKGSGLYVVTASYDVTFKKSLSDLEREINMGKSPFGMEERNGAAPFGNLMALMALKTGYGEFKAGTTVHAKEDFLFQKTEKGWMFTEQLGETGKHK